MHKTAIITGANRGIGKTLVEEFAKSGFDVYACARGKNEAYESKLVDQSERYGVEIVPVYFDMRDERQINLGLKEILSRKKKIDVLINNAGIAYGGLLTMTSINKLKEVYQVNVLAQVQIMQLVARQMMKQKAGCIINMCSVGGIETSPGYLAYGSSKAAMIWITKSVAKELGAYNIRVNGIAPGLIDTEMGHYKTEAELEKVMNRMSIRRMGKPEEIAKAALYISSDDAAYMTGQIMILDGGRV